VNIEAPAKGKETSEHSVLKWTALAATIVGVLPVAIETFSSNVIEGKGWLAAIAAALMAGAMAYLSSRTAVKQAHETAKAEAFKVLADGVSPEAKAAALERMAAGKPGIGDEATTGPTS